MDKALEFCKTHADPNNAAATLECMKNYQEIRDLITKEFSSNISPVLIIMAMLVLGAFVLGVALEKHF